MLEAWSKHALMDLQVDAKGDLDVDLHHTVEDVGICLGKALREAVGDKKGIVRYGASFLPMDEALLHAAVDISGRPHLVFNVPLRGSVVLLLVEGLLFILVSLSLGILAGTFAGAIMSAKVMPERMPSRSGR